MLLARRGPTIIPAPITAVPIYYAARLPYVCGLYGYC